MIITRKAIPRRTVLRGLGATLALPLLDGMIPALTAQARTAAAPINRFGVMYVVNGMIMESWTPAAEGAGYELTPTLAALAPHRDRFSVLSGLACVPSPGRPGGAHAKASTRFLTDVSPPTSETWLDAGVSVDQLLARERRPAHAAGLARAGDRVGRDGRRVRRRLRVRLHEHDLLAQRQHAAADREQPARRVRAIVRRQRQHRSEGAPRPHRAGRSVLDSVIEEAGAPQGIARPARRRQAGRVPRRDSRRRTAHSAGRGTERARAAASSIIRPACPTASTITSS